MTDGKHRYCDRCWAIILDRGYVDEGDLCERCWLGHVADVGVEDAQLVDVVHVERLIV